MIPFGPHAGQPLLRSGPPVDKAANAVIAIHGRGANASDIISIAKTLKVPDTAWLAPEAAAHTWYPYSFLNPVEQNQPFLDSAISIVGGLLQHLQDSGMPLERAVLLGFSQGACLASEFVARYPRRYGGVVIFSGGLIGEQIDPASFQGSLEQTPIFGGCSDSDPHIPLERFEVTGEILGTLGGAVDFRVYPGMGHTINIEELTAARDLIAQLGGA
ncbi:MAG: dienelactone hydrolase family protein [Thermomicrobiales bacterium]|nr:dienelactone hydrolase family protein [Thermomicrobiales bacterium]